MRKLALEESSCLDSSDFDVSSISDLGSPLLLTEQRMSPCGQDYSPDGESGFIFRVNPTGNETTRSLLMFWSFPEHGCLWTGNLYNYNL